jgi:hypothetical protein
METDPNFCQKCHKIKPEQKPGYVTFHICNTANKPEFIVGEVVEDVLL